jgi:hypothetical protein
MNQPVTFHVNGTFTPAAFPPRTVDAMDNTTVGFSALSSGSGSVRAGDMAGRVATGAHDLAAGVNVRRLTRKVYRKQKPLLIGVR